MDQTVYEKEFQKYSMQVGVFKMLPDHLKPEFVKRLADETLKRYADTQHGVIYPIFRQEDIIKAVYNLDIAGAFYKLLVNMSQDIYGFGWAEANLRIAAINELINEQPLPPYLILKGDYFPTTKNVLDYIYMFLVRVAVSLDLSQKVEWEKVESDIRALMCKLTGVEELVKEVVVEIMNNIEWLKRAALIRDGAMVDIKKDIEKVTAKHGIGIQGFSLGQEPATEDDFCGALMGVTMKLVNEGALPASICHDIFIQYHELSCHTFTINIGSSMSNA